MFHPIFWAFWEKRKGKQLIKCLVVLALEQLLAASAGTGAQIT